MLLSNSGNFIYLKTHKTGSTAAEFALIPYCAPPNHKEGQKRKETLISSYGIVGARNSGDRTKKAKNRTSQNKNNIRYLDTKAKKSGHLM